MRKCSPSPPAIARGDIRIWCFEIQFKHYFGRRSGSFSSFGINQVVSDAVLLHVNGTVAFILWFEPNATKRQKYISPIKIIDQAPFQCNCGFRHWLIDWPLIALHNHSQQTAKIQFFWHNEKKHKHWDDGIQISLCTLSLGLILTINSSLAGGQISCLLLSKIINFWKS